MSRIACWWGYDIFKSKAALCSFFFLCVVSLGGCGADKDSGANIGISVSPESPSFIEAVGSSCVDKTAALTTETVAEKSVPALRITYSRFILTWVGTTNLRIDSIRVTIESESIAGGQFSKSLDPDEIEALIGFKNAELIYSNLGGSTTFDSARAGKVAADGTQWASCGLTIGGVELADPKNASSFTASVEIELKGATFGPDGEETPVLKKTRARAQYDY